MQRLNRTIFLAGVLLLLTPFGVTGEQGRQLYLEHCGQCHGPEGKGFRQLYPPLNGSPYFSERLSHLPCLIQLGRRGDILLPDGSYNQTMPGNDRLNTGQLTSLLQYSQRFAPDQNATFSTLTPSLVEQWLLECKVQ